MYGPFVGSTNNLGMLNKSITLERIAEHFERVLRGVDYDVYGDEAYVLSRHAMRPYSKHFSHNIEGEGNTLICRVCVGARDGIRKSLSII